MLSTKKLSLGNVTQSRTALTIFAATLLIGGSVTEASAKSRHHHRHHHHHAGGSDGSASASAEGYHPVGMNPITAL